MLLLEEVGWAELESDPCVDAADFAVAPVEEPLEEGGTVADMLEAVDGEE